MYRHQLGAPLDNLALSRMDESQRFFWLGFFKEAETVINDLENKGEAKPFTPPDSLKAKYEEALAKYDGERYCQIKQLQAIFNF